MWNIIYCKKSYNLISVSKNINSAAIFPAGKIFSYMKKVSSVWYILL